MKKFLLLAVSVFLGVQTNFAQQVPNGGFETWAAPFPPILNMELPTGWITSELFTSPLLAGWPSSATKTTDRKEGSFALKLTTPADTVAGFAQLGALDIANQTATQGVPFTLRPDSLVVYIKTTSAQDTSVIVVSTRTGTAGNPTVVGEAYIELSQVYANYTRIAVPFQYASTGTPDSLDAAIALGAEDDVRDLTSALYIDGLKLVYNTTVGTIETPLMPEWKAVFAPNPARDFTEIIIPAEQTNQENVWVLYDQLGRVAKREVLRNTRTTVDVTTFAMGNYFYQVLNNKGELVDGGVLNIVK